MASRPKMFPLTKPYLRALGMRSWKELAEKDFVRNGADNDKIILKFDWNIKFQGKVTSGTAECFINRGDLLINLAKERYNGKRLKKSILGKASGNGIER
jgi:hypothetical protein